MKNIFLLCGLLTSILLTGCVVLDREHIYNATSASLMQRNQIIASVKKDKECLEPVCSVFIIETKELKRDETVISEEWTIGIVNNDEFNEKDVYDQTFKLNVDFTWDEKGKFYIDKISS